MAYESDDLRPVRSVKACREHTPERIEQCDTQNKVVAGPTREGDDDLRPPRPSADVLRRRDEERSLAVEKLSQDVKVSNHEMTDVRHECPADRELGLLRLCAYACGAIVSIWLLSILWSVIHSMIVAQSLTERIVLGSIALLALGIVVHVVCYARKIFTHLPKFAQLKRSDYRDDITTLSGVLRKEYICDFPKRDAYAKMVGFKEGAYALDMLERLKEHRYADSVGFMEEYDKFQNALDERALEVIKKYALLIAIKTAASPWKVVDMIAVFYNSSLMVWDLAVIYNRKTSRREAFLLVLNWFVNLYISGEFGEIMEGGADTVASGVSDWLPHEGIGAVIQPVVPLLAKFGGKLVEGGANAYLAYRLGHRASLYFKALVD